MFRFPVGFDYICTLSCLLLLLLASKLFFLLRNSVWKELNTSAKSCQPRAGHSTVSFGKNLFVFGGFTDAQNLFDDLHMLTVETGMWTLVMTTGDGPSARFSVAGDCLAPLKVVCFVFIGGCNKSLEALEDMYYLHTGKASAESGVVLNGDYNSKSKTSKTLNQDAVENIQPDNLMGWNPKHRNPRRKLLLSLI
ncbi:hypothetical protein NC652_028710 [Populus alba x Populus x berolinensis]|nr:hypothetical protein NC652_028710 [Populus alba x Populus x berolinensis]